MLSNPRRELFARLIAYGKSATQAYIDAGFSEKGAAQSACRLRDDPEVTKRIREIQSEVGAKLEAAGIRDINERIREYQNRWQKMKDVTDSRAADPTMKHVPGGHTGLLVRTVKSVRDGSDTTIVEEFAVDTGLLREMRELELQVSKELGQFIEKHEHGGTVIDRLNAARERMRSGDGEN